MFKNNNIGFDCSTRRPRFESFTATLKKNIRETVDIGFKIAYLEINNKSHLCIIFSLNQYQKELKEIQNELEARKQMLKYVAHDMRNPLSSNQLLLEAADFDPTINNNAKDRFIKPCLKTLKYLFALVNDLVDSALISAGKFKLVIGEVNVNELVQDVLQIFDLKAKPKEIALRKQIGSGVPLLIFTDSARLTQILINLVSNSLKYTQKRGTITIKVEKNILNSNKIDFSVEDTGIGIRMENQKDLLKDFAKVEGNKDSELNPYGVGLGLSISNKLALNLNVDGAQDGIKIDSTVGKGTKMKFSVENRKPESLSKIPSDGALTEIKKYSENYSSSIDEKANNSSGLPKQTGSNKSISNEQVKIKKALTTLRRINELDVISSGHKLHSKVLIIDDDAFAAESVNMILHTLGLTADKAFNTKEALKKLEELANLSKVKGQVLGYDLIFMDAMMEDMDGFESTKILKEKMKNGEIKEAPIVFCTGLDSESEDQAMEAGANYFVTKPISRANLVNILKKSNIETAVKM